MPNTSLGVKRGPFSTKILTVHKVWDGAVVELWVALLSAMTVVRIQSLAELDFFYLTRRALRTVRPYRQAVQD